MKLIHFIFLLLFISSLHAQTYTDDKNVYFTSQHFRAIAGVDYNNSVSTANMAQELLNAAEASWNKEVVELGFRHPRNTDTKLIDIYIGNTSAYDYENERYVTISSTYAGYAWYYLSDRTPYFVMNPSLSSNIIKVTMAHEFFHTIQYAYFTDDDFTDTKWFKNIWWLEATAVLMEDEVYDDINDYIGFLSPFFNASYKSFEIYNGSHEYSMVIFAKYIKEKYGFQIIKDSLSAIETSGDNGFFEILGNLLEQDYNSSMPQALDEFAKWVSHADKYFEEGDLYPPLKHYKNTDNITLQKGGIEAVDNLANGWNMVSLTKNNSIDALDIDNLKVIWSYKDGSWKNSVQKEIGSSDSNLGYWVETDNNSSLYYTYFDTTTYDIATLSDGWHLLGTTKTIGVDNFTTPVIVWQYKNGIWSAYSNDATTSRDLDDQGYAKIETILPYSSFWIKKI
ncbi:hypothetical protein MNB_SM-5-1097 [hydrothermal vent metagenome]|uniref:Uncharacterized protein n=1 Tax=hydrothermal vent metagenome TaxID=652676 RepID=A0A1W1CYJ2_9ZZZZ